MSINRIKELQNYADEFYKRLQLSEEESSPIKDDKCIYSYNNKMIKKSLSTIVQVNKNKELKFSKSLSNNNLNNKGIKLKPIVMRNQNKLNVYNTLRPWVPPSYFGNYFESYKRLPDHHCISDWEKVIIFYIKIFLASNSFM